MPKPYTFPLVLDHVKSLSISKLKEWSYLNTKCCKSGIISWSRAGQKAGSISVYCNMIVEEPYVRLKYKLSDELLNYEIRLVSIPSNLGTGKVWYFLCPVTGKRCRKLYRVDQLFLHRDAHPHAMYECQTYSKNRRIAHKAFFRRFALEDLNNQIYSKYFKTHYAGKRTKRYKRILKRWDFFPK